MLPLQFFGQNIHFAINLFAALVLFAVFWLYFDAWISEHDSKTLVRSIGFLLVSLSFVAESTVIEQSVLGNSTLNSISTTTAGTLAFIGFMMIIFSRLIDPMQRKPDLTGLKEEEFNTTKPTKTKLQAASAAGITTQLHWLPPLAALGVAFHYWRRATHGLERHLRLIAVAFGLIFISELLGMSSLLRNNTNPTISRLVASFGPLWIAQLVFLLAASLVLGAWVRKYLTRRFTSQLFMIFTSVTLAIFVITAVTFTFLLVNNIQNTSLDNLETAAGVLNYAVGSKKTETLSDIQTVAENPGVAAAVISGDHNSLTGLTATYLRDKQQSSLTLTNNSAEVLLRADNPDRFGDSISSDASIRRALIGQSVTSISAENGILAPVISIDAAVPIRNTDGDIVGAAEGGLVLDNAFVLGIKQSTGLDSSIYADNEVSATTFLQPDGLTPWVGVKETNAAVQRTVLKDDLTYKGVLSIQNRQYLSVFAPLKDINGNIIGMFFVGKPQVTILQTAGRAVELTFAVTALLIVLSIAPAYIISKYLSRQLD